uniref:Carbonic anhydrase 8 n=1 Tax=Chrysemys picta bellii TaxID=8478 RepID=A0A8C3IGE6_CHRPI
MPRALQTNPPLPSEVNRLPQGSPAQRGRPRDAPRDTAGVETLPMADKSFIEKPEPFPQKEEALEWGYEEGVEWGLIFPDANGEYQSPINLNSREAKYDPSLLEVRLSPNYVVCRDCEVINDGHSIQIILKSKSDPLLRDYWVYEGSLTIPPCSESVTWILFRYPLTVSQLQIEEFRRLRTHVKGAELLEGCDGMLGDNFRPTQPLSDRVIRAAFQ